MKAILIFALVAIAACSEAPVEQDLQSNIVDTIKCFVEKALPLLPQVTEIITALKEQDFMTVMMIGMAMYEDIKEMIDVCVPKEQILAAKYDAFIECAKTIREDPCMIVLRFYHYFAILCIEVASLLITAEAYE